VVAVDSNVLVHRIKFRVPVAHPGMQRRNSIRSLSIIAGSLRASGGEDANVVVGVSFAPYVASDASVRASVILVQLRMAEDGRLSRAMN
jgi:hypothetical protein